jgi:hypothetical protein
MSVQGQLAAKAVKQALGIEGQLEQQLGRIEEQVKAGLQGPYHSGLIRLEEACRPGVAATRRDELLKLAEDRFIDAVGNLEKVDPAQGAWAAIHVAGVCKLQERADDAQRWAIQAHDDAVKAVDRLCELVNDRVNGKLGSRVRRLKLTTQDGAGGAVVGGIGLTLVISPLLWPAIPAGIAAAGGIEGWRHVQAKRARSGLEDLSRFANELAELAEGIGATGVARHRLHFDSKDNEFSFLPHAPARSAAQLRA